MSFQNPESWVILSPIEKGIREKIESVGKPLKDWEIEIYRGILTGFNEAFIIDSKTREKLIDCDPKSADIIRPILRGRDIKRFGYAFGNHWLINTHNGIKNKGIERVNIADYPAIKAHLDKFYLELEKRADKGDTPYNLRNCAYMEDFLRPKIIYPDIMRMPSQYSLLHDYPYFYLDNDGFFAEATNFILCGEDLDILCSYLASSVGFFCFAKFYTGPQFDDTGFRYKKDYLQNLIIPDFSLFDIPKLKKTFAEASAKNGSVDRSTHYRKIDRIFMEGVGFTADEIAYVTSFKESLLGK